MSSRTALTFHFAVTSHPRLCVVLRVCVDNPDKDNRRRLPASEAERLRHGISRSRTGCNEIRLRKQRRRGGASVDFPNHLSSTRPHPGAELIRVHAEARYTPHALYARKILEIRWPAILQSALVCEADAGFDRLARVVPANAGTHTPRSAEVTRCSIAALQQAIALVHERSLSATALLRWITPYGSLRSQGRQSHFVI